MGGPGLPPCRGMTRVSSSCPWGRFRLPSFVRGGSGRLRRLVLGPRCQAVRIAQMRAVGRGVPGPGRLRVDDPRASSLPLWLREASFVVAMPARRPVSARGARQGLSPTGAQTAARWSAASGASFGTASVALAIGECEVQTGIVGAVVSDAWPRGLADGLARRSHRIMPALGPQVIHSSPPVGRQQRRRKCSSESESDEIGAQWE